MHALSFAEQRQIEHWISRGSGVFGELSAGVEAQPTVDGLAVRRRLQDGDPLITAGGMEGGQGDGAAVSASTMGGQRADVVDPCDVRVAEDLGRADREAC